MIYTSIKTISAPNSSQISTNELLDFNCFIGNDEKLNILSNLNSTRDAELKLYNISGKLLCSRNLKLKVNQI